MKHLLGFVLFALATTQVNAVEFRQMTCFDYEKEARSVMTYRQQDNASLSEALSSLENMVSEFMQQGAEPEVANQLRERFRWLIIDTFKEMQFSTDSGKKRKINQYANERMLDCLRTTGRD